MSLSNSMMQSTHFYKFNRQNNAILGCLRMQSGKMVCMVGNSNKASSETVTEDRKNDIAR